MAITNITGEIKNTNLKIRVAITLWLLQWSLMVSYKELISPEIHVMTFCGHSFINLFSASKQDCVPFIGPSFRQ